MTWPSALVEDARVIRGLLSQPPDRIDWPVIGKAIQAPLREISANAGLDGRAIVAAGERLVPGQTYDAWKGAWVDPWQAGLLDSTAVLVKALEAGASAASTALLSEVLIHRPGQEPSFSP